MGPPPTGHSSLPHQRQYLLEQLLIIPVTTLRPLGLFIDHLSRRVDQYIVGNPGYFEFIGNLAPLFVIEQMVVALQSVFFDQDRADDAADPGEVDESAHPGIFVCGVGIGLE